MSLEGARRTVAEISFLIASKVGLGLAARACGFTHVSDDDFARTTIAQAFAHAPRLDPSGTSWLPFPFWVTGSVMAVLGRSLEIAIALQWAVGIAAPVCVYLAAKQAVDRKAALVGAWIFAATPWGVWLGLATVPELPTATFVAVAVFLLGSPGSTPRLAALGGACALAAALSRYEAWPVCAILAVRPHPPGSPLRRSAGTVARGLCALGPLGWMGWNLRAHGDPLHFFARVSTFRVRAEDGGSLGERLLLYPRALVIEAPEIAVLGALACVALAVPALGRRHRVTLAAALSVLLFLAYGSVRDGAPTHHVARALVVVFPLLAVTGLDVALHMYSTYVRGGARWAAWGTSGLALAAFLIHLGRALERPPGASAAEDRTAQLARGRELRGAPADTRFELSPCAYEHFATIAAFGAPERITVLPSGAAPVTASCPGIRQR